jgi:hypothetical protein
MLLPMNAEDDAAFLHRPQNIAADEVIHRHAVLRVRRAMWRVVFAGPQQTGSRAFADHRRRRLPREIKRHDELLKDIRPRRPKLRRITLDAPAITLSCARDSRHRWLCVWHRQSARAAHVEMCLDIRSHRRALAEVRVEVEPLGKREGHARSLARYIFGSTPDDWP